MQPPLIIPKKSPQTINHYRPNKLGLEEVEVLELLGLTNRQARVYLALLKTGNGKAKTIADLSLVNRQEIYRILESLQQIGLVQKNISTPTTFTVTPFDNVAKILLTEKTTQLIYIRQKTRQLIKKLQNNSDNTTNELNKNPCIGTVFEGQRGEKYRQTISATCQSIDIITSWKRFNQLTTLLETPLQQAIQKAINIRIITEKQPNQPLPNWITNTQTQTINKKRHNLKIKTLPKPPTAAITIFDHTTAAIAFHPNNSLTKGPDLWTTNPTLIALSQTYFNSMWTQTKHALHQTQATTFHKNNFP